MSRSCHTVLLLSGAYFWSRNTLVGRGESQSFCGIHCVENGIQLVLIKSRGYNFFSVLDSCQHISESTCGPVADLEICQWGHITCETCGRARWPFFLTSFNRAREGMAPLVSATVDRDTVLVCIVYMSCHHSLGATGATLNTRNASS